MTDEKDKEIMTLKLEIRRLQAIICLQKDIIDSYKELAEIKTGNVVIQ